LDCTVKKKFSDLKLFESYIEELDFVIEEKNSFSRLQEGKLFFLNDEHVVDWETVWHDSKLTHLWRYNVHYFDYIKELCSEYRSSTSESVYLLFRKLVLAWIDNNRECCGDGWHQYTVSLRLTNWISAAYVFRNAIRSDSSFGERFATSLYRQYCFLMAVLEKDVLGNHYLENLKSLIICSLVFGESKINNWAENALISQIDEQIHDDGMHFELSPMYHKIVFEDLLKIAFWQRTVSSQFLAMVLDKLTSMADCIYSFEHGLETTPLFNDSADNVAKSADVLLAVAYRLFSIVPRFKSEFSHSGYYVLESGARKIIFDIGKLCPDYLPAHAHCDTLSFEMYRSGKPVVSNSGTYSYSEWPWRGYFRSTAAHNTVVINNHQQAECWSSFRVARRTSNICFGSFGYDGYNVFWGEYHNYRGDLHRRYLLDISEKLFIVLDYGDCPICKSMNSFLHFDQRIRIDKISKDGFWAIDEDFLYRIGLINFDDVKVHFGEPESGWCAKEFGKKQARNTVEMSRNFAIQEKRLTGYVVSLGSEELYSNILADSLSIDGIGKQRAIDLAELDKLRLESICV